MKVVIAMDSFKGSLSSINAGNAAKAGIERVCNAEIIVKPLADGGEGTTDALIEGLGGEYVTLSVTGPLGEKTTAKYGILSDKKTAVMEIAEAAGIVLAKRQGLNPLKATTYGVGEMILGRHMPWMPGIYHWNRGERYKRRRCRNASGIGL